MPRRFDKFCGLFIKIDKGCNKFHRLKKADKSIVDSIFWFRCIEREGKSKSESDKENLKENLFVILCEFHVL